MSYIRTKNGIYEVIKNELGECIKIDGGFILLDDIRLIEQNIREADTIEELCDGFIGITTKEYPNRPDIEPNINYFQKPFEFMYDNNIIKHLKLIDVELRNQNGWSYSTKKWFEYCDIYGFVRTSKGLIYVAKLNENEELVLI